jgi:ABC-2 type transport system permease protein
MSAARLLILLVQDSLLVLVAIPFGLDFDLVGFLVTLGLLALIGLVLTSISYALAIRLKSEDARAPVLKTVTFPLLWLSGIYLPMSLAPG